MADSLDDFFAKKDKSKKKGKSKFTASDLLAKQNEEPKRAVRKKKEEKPAESGSKAADGGDPGPEKVDEEWSEYVEEEAKDYSGLRIQSIQIREEDSDQTDKERSGGGEAGDGEDGEERSEGQSGPWANKQQSVTETVIAEPPPPKEEPAAPPPARTGKYVPPGMRNQAGGLADMPRSHLRRKKEAPNLQSEEDFPTLGAGNPDQDSSGGAWASGGRFERVRSGGRQTEEHTSQGPRLQLGNKFDALTGGAD